MTARSFAVLAIQLAVAHAAPAQEPKPDSARELFNGEDLDGWKIIEDQDFKRHGAVTVEEGQIVLEAGQPATGIVWKEMPPAGEYEISLEARRLAGDDFFCGLTFPIGDEFASLIIGGWGGGVTGLSNINGMSAVENETTGYQQFKKDEWYAIRLRVTEEKVEAWIGEEQIVDVERKEKRFAVWWEQEPARPLGIVTWNTKGAVRKIVLKSAAP
jgi:hypothetical protein